MGEDRTHAHSVGKGRDRLTIAEAAALLGVHKNTVRNRIKKGSYRAEMIQTERGPTYLIERESLLTDLTTNTLSSGSQSLVSQSAMEFVQELLRPFVSELGEVREELGAERARRVQAEERVASLEAELEAFREPRESPETVEEEPEKVEPRQATGGAQEGSERPQQRSGWLVPVDKLPWWYYVLGSFLVFLSGCAATAVAYNFSQWPAFVILLVGAWLLPGVFGFWIGFRLKNPRFWSQIIPIGALIGAAPVLGLIVYGTIDTLITYGKTSFSMTITEALINVIGDVVAQFLVVGISFPAWLLYVSAALIGNAWQRRRAGRTSGTIPASPVSRSSRAGPVQRDDWTPRKQAILGWSGTIISSLITLIGTIITVMSSGP